jgi:hypothetical protein
MRKLAALLALVCIPVLLAVTGGAVHAGTPACNGTKIDPVNSGTYALAFGVEAGSITLTVHQTAQGPTFDFQTDSASHLVTTAAVKGGPVDPVVFVENSSTGTGLHSAHNPNTGKWYGLSYICLNTFAGGE